MDEAYVEGFMAKCAEHGIDPEELVKQAVPPAGRYFGGGLKMPPRSGTLGQIFAPLSLSKVGPTALGLRGPSAEALKAMTFRQRLAAQLKHLGAMSMAQMGMGVGL